MQNDTQVSDAVQNKFEDKDVDFLVEQYQALSASRISQNEALWSIPMLFLTAQSFLITLALGGASHFYWEKAIAAFIASIFGFLSIQVFERNRIMIVSDAEQLLDIERYLLSRGYTGFELHQKLSKRKYLRGDSVYLDMLTKKRFTFLGRGISVDMWKYGMWFSTIVSFVIFIFNLLMFSNCKFLGFETFRTFLGSVDKSSVTLIVIIITFTLIFYVLNNIEPRNSILNKDQRRTVRYAFLISVSLIVFLAIFYSYLANIRAFPYFRYIWLCLFMVWSIIMVSASVLLRSNRKKACVNNDGIATLILAGGRGLRLESIIGNHAKFIVIQSDKKPLLVDTLIRNKKISEKQIIVTSDNFRETIVAIPEIEKAVSGETKAQASSDESRKTKQLIILNEPCSKGTAPAIFLALKNGFEEEDQKVYKEKMGYDPVIIVAPSDHVIGDKDSYHRTISKACQLAKDFDNIYLIGVIPTCPSEQYGYISVGNVTASIQRIRAFKEKPKQSEIQELTKAGSVLWNSGIFIARRSVFLKAYENTKWKSLGSYECDFLSDADRDLIFDTEDDAASFDVDILEKATNLFVIPVTFDWVDVGDPQTLQSAILAGLCEIDETLLKDNS